MCCLCLFVLILRTAFPSSPRCWELNSPVLYTHSLTLASLRCIKAHYSCTNKKFCNWLVRCGSRLTLAPYLRVIAGTAFVCAALCFTPHRVQEQNTELCGRTLLHSASKQTQEQHGASGAFCPVAPDFSLHQAPQRAPAVDGEKNPN